MNDGDESAFPNTSTAEGHANNVPQGMTLRDYFAARAFERLVEAHIQGTVDDLSKDIIAREAYSYADAMLEARK